MYKKEVTAAKQITSIRKPKNAGMTTPTFNDAVEALVLTPVFSQLATPP
jgi:hypothetical protein